MRLELVPALTSPRLSEILNSTLNFPSLASNLNPEYVDSNLRTRSTISTQYEKKSESSDNQVAESTEAKNSFSKFSIHSVREESQETDGGVLSKDPKPFNWTSLEDLHSNLFRNSQSHHPPVLDTVWIEKDLPYSPTYKTVCTIEPTSEGFEVRVMPDDIGGPVLSENFHYDWDGVSDKIHQLRQSVMDLKVISNNLEVLNETLINLPDNNSVTIHYSSLHSPIKSKKRIKEKNIKLLGELYKLLEQAFQLNIDVNFSTNDMTASGDSSYVMNQ